jgi:hypothetical protein
VSNSQTPVILANQNSLNSSNICLSSSNHTPKPIRMTSPEHQIPENDCKSDESSHKYSPGHIPRKKSGFFIKSGVGSRARSRHSKTDILDQTGSRNNLPLGLDTQIVKSQASIDQHVPSHQNDLAKKKITEQMTTDDFVEMYKGE